MPVRNTVSTVVLPSTAVMDVVSAVSGYVSKMVLAGDTSLGSSSSKMKILLLDSETVRVYVIARKRFLADSKRFQSYQPLLRSLHF